jgi:hypothetical protein
MIFNYLKNKYISYKKNKLIKYAKDNIDLWYSNSFDNINGKNVFCLYKTFPWTREYNILSLIYTDDQYYSKLYVLKFNDNDIAYSTGFRDLNHILEHLIKI